jgi:hypothetical protein
MSARNSGAASRKDTKWQAFGQTSAGLIAVTDAELMRVNGGRPCRDDNDTNCYCLVTLECRSVSSVASFRL